MQIEINNDNSEEILAALERKIATALEACGLVAEGYAKAVCPVDTGNLRNSISHKVEKEEGACYIGTNVEYAPYVEFGTGQLFKGGTGGRQTAWTHAGKSTHGHRPQPYLRPALADHVERYKNIIKNELRG